MRRWAWRVGVIAAAVIAHEGLCRWLDRARVVERLLAAGGVTTAALLSAVALYALRFALVFVAPGMIVGWVVVEVLERRARRDLAASPPSGIASRAESANAPGAPR